MYPNKLQVYYVSNPIFKKQIIYSNGPDSYSTSEPFNSIY